MNVQRHLNIVSSLEQEDVERLASFFNAIGNSIRLKILLTLQQTRRPLHIKAISKQLGVDYAAIYRHVKLLEAAGFIEIFEVGRSRVLSLTPRAPVDQLIKLAQATFSNNYD